MVTCGNLHWKIPTPFFLIAFFPCDTFFKMPFFYHIHTHTHRKANQHTFTQNTHTHTLTETLYTHTHTNTHTHTHTHTYTHTLKQWCAQTHTKANREERDIWMFVIILVPKVLK